MKQLFMSLFFCAFLCNLISAQEPPKLPDVVPPSPTAFELGKFGEIPVGKFNGTPNVNIPLYTYSTKNMSVPISLSYSNAGIRVNQISSWVGLGWNLNVGGVITRMAKGIADETYGGTRDFPDEAMNDFINTNNHLHPAATKFIYEMAGANKDGEHDVYNFNFQGNTGQFVIDREGKMVLLRNSAPVKITSQGIQANRKFFLTTSDGIQYEFTKTELTRNSNECVTSAPDNSAITAWYLTKMTHPFGDQIHFDYTPVSYNYIMGKRQNYSKSLGKGIGDCSCPDDNYSSCNQWITLSGQKLVKIWSNNPVNGTINFNATLAHPEITNYTLLQNMQVVNQASQLVERFDFTYTITTNNRVFLNKLTQKNPAQKHHFSYHNETSFPARQSYAQDHWGYYNGKNNNTTLLVKPNSAIWNNVTGLIGADRTPNALYTKVGLLKKVTYPTAGSTQLIYEPNTYYGGKTTYKDTIYQVNSNPQSPTLSSTILFATGNTYQNTAIYPTRITGYEDIDNLLCNQCTGEGTITLTDLTTNQLISTSTVIPGQSIDIPVTLTKNHNYELKITTTGALHYLAQLRYFDGTTLIDNHTGPGMRVQKTKAYDPVTQQEIVKRYYYTPRANRSLSSGTNYRAPRYETATMTGFGCSSTTSGGVGCGMKFCYYSNLSSNTVNTLVDQRGGMIFYKQVTTSLGGDNFEAGMEEHEYIIHQLDANRQVWGSGEYSGVSMLLLNQDAADNGLEKRVVYYRKDGTTSFTKLYEKENFYPKDTTYHYVINNYITTRLYQPLCEAQWPNYSCKTEDLSTSYPYITCSTNHEHFWKPINGLRCVAAGNNNQISFKYHPCYGKPINYTIQVNHNTIGGTPLPIDMIQYDHVSERYPLTQTMERFYDENGSNPLEKTTNYYYDNPLHLQITRTKVTDSKGDTLETKVYYPDDLASITGLTPSQENALKKLDLNNQHRVSQPIQTQSYRNGNLLATQRTLFKDWGNEILLPEEIQTLKGTTGTLESRIQYQRYDNKGNPLEVSQPNGMTITYLWGYGGKYVVAKIDNATYNSVTAPSIGLNLNILENPSSEAALLAELAKIRTALPAAMVTTFAYKPLVGVTKKVDPRGRETTYSYDTYNRLETIRDHDGNLLSKNTYHYKNQ
ncbi:RHS repeat domain-containing protein [Ascidiimonas sp. W6]|uniref:RHS repeat domain-containing protein n=1 Tax=Ascidiimonas meishanensis TaxID=3128903 RepID=UPI0030EF407D